MSNIVIGGRIFNGVNTIKVKDTSDEFVAFNENPFIVDATQTPDASYLGKLCKDATTGQYYMVARGNNNNFVLNSIDPAQCVVDLKYINNKWLKVTQSSNTAILWVSNDGSTWTQVKSANSYRDSGGYGQIAYGNGVYVFTCFGSGTLYSSTDLENWTSHTFTDNSPSIKYITFGNGRFLLHMTYGSSTTYYKAYYSTNGTSWTSTSSISIVGLTFWNGYFYRVSYQNSSQPYYMRFDKSLDGISWTLGALPNINTTNFYSPVYTFKEIGDKFYFAASLSGYKLYCIGENDANWTQLTAPGGYYAYSLIKLNNTFYAGTSNGRIYYSNDDCVYWTQFEFVSDDYIVMCLETDGSKIIGCFDTTRGSSVIESSYYIVSDSSDNLYYRPIYY